MIVELIKEYLVPGSATFLLIGASVGSLLLFGRKKVAQWGRRLLTTLLILYWLLATPVVARSLEAALRDDYGPLEDPVIIEDVEALVVLGGGSVTHIVDDEEMNILSDVSAMRILEALRLYPQLQDPWVIVSGGVNERVGRMTAESYPLRDALVEGGVPVDRIIMESSSRDTYEQAIQLAPVFERHDIVTFIMVTSETHMRRSMLVFEAQGFDPIPSTAPQHSDGQPLSRWGFFPDEHSLDASRSAAREIMALIYYALSGRLSP